MADRVVKVTLRAEVAGYAAGMQTAAKATQAVGSEADKLAAKRQGFETLGKSMMGVGLAVTAVGVAAARTGIQYNTLQQTTRAAMTTMLGSAKAANEQMDRLDEFARQSPFAKQVFISAQQQMLAFGVETQKVLPYLDAIQEAVAAAGGNNNDIAGLAEIMAKIQSSANITATDLMQFGNYGIDAAGLIGEAMGKTGAQIREDITSGSIDATAALDALASGMQSKFAGASANVKNTFEGSVDRIKAAWRDLAGELMTPLVDPNGGGALIDLANNLADLMRKFQALPEPVRNTITVVGAAAGGLLLLGGAAIAAVPKIVALRTAMTSLGISSATVGRNVAAAGKAMGVAAGAVGLAVLLDRIATGGPKAALGVNEITAALTSGDMNAALGNARGLEDALDVLLGGSIDDVGTRGLSALNQALGGYLSDKAQEATDSFNGMGEALAGLVSSGQADEAARLFAEVADAAALSGYSTDDLLSIMPAYRDALAEQANASAIAADTSESHTRQMTALGRAAIDAKGEVISLADAIKGFAAQQFAADNANLAFKQSILDLNSAMGADGFTGTLNTSKQEGIDNLKMLMDVAESANRAAGEYLDLTDDVEGANAILGEGRQVLKDVGGQFGLAGQELEDFINKYVVSPKDLRFEVQARVDQADMEMYGFLRRWDGKRFNLVANVTGPGAPAIVANNGTGRVAFADGGGVTGPGPKGRDSVPAMLAPGEHVLTDKEVDRLGGQQAVYRFREQLMSGNVRGFAMGGNYTTSDRRQFRSSVRSGQFDLDRGVSQVWDFSENYDFSRGQRSRFAKVADQSEKRMIALEKAAERADKRLEKAQDRLGTFTSKLDDLNRSAESMSSSIAGRLGGVRMDAPTGAALAQGFAKQAGGLTQFESELKKLRAKGVSPELLAEIAGMGLEEGLPMARSMNEMTSGQIRQLNSSYSSIQKTSGRIGDQVADANYGKLITQAEKQVAAAEAGVKAAEKGAQDIQDAIARETKKLRDLIGSVFGVKGYADGGFAMDNGIYAGAGAGLYRMAEKESQWELLVSGKPSKRKENQGYVLEAANRLGMVFGPGSSSSAPNIMVAAPSLEGMRLVGTMDLGNGLEARMDARIAASDQVKAIDAMGGTQ